jgi:hypothetical protein
VKRRISRKELTARLIAARNVSARMPSLLLVPENEEVATASCGYNLYPKYMTPS